MEIVVNTRLLIKDKLDGIGWFTYQTLKRITQNHPEIHFTFLFDRPFDSEFIFGDNVTPIVLSPPARHPFLYVLYFQFSVKRYLKKTKPDLFLSPDGFLVTGVNCKQLPVIHDINFFHNPKDLTYFYSRYYNYFFPKFASIASRIATVSEYSKQDISDSYHINPAKIDVVYNGIQEGFIPLDESSKNLIRQKYSKGKPYFLFVGSQSPRKNLGRLIQAFEAFRKTSTKEYCLILAGSSFWGDSELKKIWESCKYKSDILFTGRVSQEELQNIMASAFCLTFIPYFEGFGIPLIEAMACNVPVICSNTTCLPEIAGKAALYVNPFSVSDVTETMVRLVENNLLYEELMAEGNKRAKDFSWERTSDLLWKCINQVITE